MIFVCSRKRIPVIGEDGTTTLAKLDTCIFPLIGALLMLAFGILKPKEAYVSIGMGGMVLTYVGVLALASGLTNTGTAHSSAAPSHRCSVKMQMDI